jgi:hypothetical protein
VRGADQPFAWGFSVDKLWGQAVDKKSEKQVIFLLRD